MVEAEGEAGFHKAPKAEGAHARQSGLNDGKLVAGQGDQPHQPPIRCPECGSQKVWKDGLRYLNDRRVTQRFLCRACGYRFSESALKSRVKLDVRSQPFKLPHPVLEPPKNSIGEPDFTFKEALNGFSLCERKNVRPQTNSSPLNAVTAQDLNRFSRYDSTCRVCASSARGAKNLAEVARQEKAQREGIKPDAETIKGKIVEFLWKMRNEGYSEKTCRTYGAYLNMLSRRGADLSDPENVKEVIAAQLWSNKTKSLACKAYRTFLLLVFNKFWKVPKYRSEDKIPFVPTEER